MPYPFSRGSDTKMGDFATALQIHAAMNAGNGQGFIYNSIDTYGYLGIGVFVLIIIGIIIFTDIL